MVECSDHAAAVDHQLAVRTSRPHGAKRTLFYGNCTCGWQSKSRTSVSTVDADHRKHVAALREIGETPHGR